MSVSPWLRRGAVLFAGWVVVCAGSWVFGLQPHPGLVALAVVAVGAALLLLLDTSGSAASADWRQVDEDPVRPVGEDTRLASLTRVVNGHLVARDVGPGLHRHLMRVADQRLMAHHGVSWVADPERAAALMAPGLAAFAGQTDPFPRLTTGQIDVLIDRIEDL